MKSTVFVVAVLLTLFVAGNVYAQNTYYLSQVANGGFNGGSFRTTFVLFNNGDSDVVASLDLTNDEGNPLVVTIDGLGTGSQFKIQLPAGSSQFLQTDGLGGLVVGGGKVTAAASIGVSAIFTVYDSVGSYMTEAGVGSSEPLSSFVLPVDVTGLFNTGIALMGVGGGDVSITTTLRSADGQLAGTTTSTLKTHGHSAKFVAGPGQLFPTISNFRGTLLVESTAPIAALVLRQNQTPLSYTSLPVVPTSSTKLTLNLAQVANGSYGGGSFRTSFLVFGVSSGTANVTLSLTKNDGSPFSVTIPDRGTGSTFSFSLAKDAAVFLQTDGAGALAAGAATITSNAPVGASAIFSVFDPQGGFQTEAGVGDSPVSTSMTLPVDITGNYNTGVAFFSPGGAALTFRLLDANGMHVGSSATRNLKVKGHLAEFVTELFAGTNNFRGSLAVSSTSAVAALTLRQNSAPLSYTTLPVASGTASGAGVWVRKGLEGCKVHVLVIDPTAPQTIYAGTEGRGMYKSTNGGDDWSAVNSGLPDYPRDVYALAIDPATPQTVYAGTWSTGVFKSTNGGGNWSAVNTGLPSDYPTVYALAIDPTAPQTIYAGTRGFVGVFKSTNGGGNWSAVNTGPKSEVYALAIDPTAPQTIYAGAHPTGLYKSTDGGGNWWFIPYFLLRLSYAIINVLVIDPTAPQTIYAGLGDTELNPGGVFKSTDGGGGWGTVNTGLANTDTNALAIDPKAPQTIYAGTGGGVYKSTNGGSNWSAVNKGLTNTSVYALAIDPAAPQTVYAGTWGGGVFKLR